MRPVLAALVLLSACGPEPERGVDTILLVTVDGLRADHLSFLGYEVATTPHLTELTAESLVCTEAVTVSTAPGAALASVLTGQVPLEHGLLGPAPGSHRLRPGAPTLAEELATRGFHTAAVVSSRRLGRRLSGLARGFAEYREAGLPADGRPLGLDVLVERAVSVIADADRSGTRLFLWTHLGSVTDEPKDLTRDEAEVVRARLGRFTGATGAMGGGWPELAAELERTLVDPAQAMRRLRALVGRRRGDPAWRAWRRALYDVSVTRLDTALGELLDAFDDRPPAVVFASTRGAYLTEERPDGAAEGSSEGVLRVPLLATSAVPRVVDRLVGLECAFDLVLDPAAVLPEPRHVVVHRTIEEPVLVGAAWKRAGLGEPVWMRRADDEVVASSALSAPERGDLERAAEPLAFRCRLGVTATRERASSLTLEAFTPVFLAVSEDGGDGESGELSATGRAVRAAGTGETMDVLVNARLRSPRPPLLARVAVDGERPAEEEVALVLRADTIRPLLDAPLPRAPHPRAPAWDPEEDGEPVVDVVREGRDLLVLVQAEAVQATLFLAVVADAEEALEVEPRTLGAERISEPGLPGAAVVTGPAPLVVRVRPSAGTPLALFCTLDGRGVPVEAVRHLGKRLAGDTLDLFLPAFLPERLDWYAPPSAGIPAPESGSVGASARISIERLPASLAPEGPLDLTPEELRLLNRLASNP